jgi:hypothetical protein
MAYENCRHNTSVPVAVLLDLPESQGGLGRHKCPSCAFKLGGLELAARIEAHGEFVKCSHGKVAPKKILKSLGDSQGGSGRHKCVICAYQVGRANARKTEISEAWSPKQKIESGSLTLIEDFEVSSFPQDNFHSVTPENPNWWEKDLDHLKKIGDIGEKLVLEYEKSYLIHNKRTDLANRVRHVSKLDGDSEGYDVRSYSIDGKAKYIEVKATTSTAGTAFYLSENERKFNSNNIDNYYLYRLFKLDIANETANFYIRIGDLSHNFNLAPTEYKVTLNKNNK